jgi:predicted nucleic acid-binding protein
VTVVSNSSPLILYAAIGRFDLLHRLFNEVMIPSAVHDEVVRAGASRPGASELLAADWIKVGSAGDSPSRLMLEAVLGRGEAEALALALELGPTTRLLIDDRDGRREARRLGIHVVGSGGVLVLAKLEALLPRVRPVLDELRSVGLRLNDAAYREVMRAADELPDDA